MALFRRQARPAPAGEDLSVIQREVDRDEDGGSAEDGEVDPRLPECEGSRSQEQRRAHDDHQKDEPGEGLDDERHVYLRRVRACVGPIFTTPAASRSDACSPNGLQERQD